jgi:hypothetical protein
MTITSTASAYRSPPQRADSARTQKDNAAVAQAQRARDNSAEQRAVAALREDSRPQKVEQPDGNERAEQQRIQAQQAQSQAQERSRVGGSLNARA